jgi:hypothetical protein
LTRFNSVTKVLPAIALDAESWVKMRRARDS